MAQTRRKRAIIAAAVGIAIAIQFVPIRHDNPPVTADLTAPAPVMATFRRACYDCHSHETRWPWYAYVAPVSWLVARDVHDGRRHLDLSAWSEYPPGDRQKKLAAIADEVEKRDMPLWFYTPLHREARLSTADLSTLVDWARAGGAPVSSSK
jgi:Haem-binding domain